MKIGWFTWQPELLDPNSPTSAGGAVWTKYLFSEFTKRGHKISYLSSSRMPEMTQRIPVEECDIIFINWRWEMPDYPERQALYHAQWRVIEEAVTANKRIIIHDQDHKMSAHDYQILKNCDVELYAPELFPREGFKTLHYPFPDFRTFNRVSMYCEWDIVYAGNMYERYEQAQQYLNAERLRAKFYGDWIENGFNKPGKDKVLNDFPHASFGSRIKQTSVISNMLEAFATIHLFKPSYGDTGFMTLRWAEAVAASTPAFLPQEFRLPDDVRSDFASCGLIVTSAEDVKKWCHSIDEGTWLRATNLQREFVYEKMSLDQWLKVVCNG